MEYITRGCFFVFCNLLLYEIGAQMRGEKKVGQFKKYIWSKGPLAPMGSRYGL